MLNECAGCTTAYAIDLELCPHCGSIEVTGDGRHGNLDAPVEPGSTFTSEMTATVTAAAKHPPGTVVDDDGSPVADEDAE